MKREDRRLQSGPQPELTKQTAIYATNIGSWIMPGVLCGVVYLAMSLPLARLGRRLERRWGAA